MSRRAPALAVAALILCGAGEARAQLFDPYLIGMMAGPVSDGPAILLLKKRQEKFMSADTLVIACTAGAASGMVAHGLPALAAGGAALGGAAMLGTGLFGCVVGAGAGATAIATQWLLNLLLPAASPEAAGG